MNRTITRLAGIGTTIALSLGGLALTATPADAAPKGCPVSSAWKHANRTERKHAKHAYLKLVGSWNNGSLADLRNSYRDQTNRTYFTHGELILTLVKGPNVLFTEESEGGCF